MINVNFMACFWTLRAKLFTNFAKLYQQRIIYGTTPLPMAPHCYVTLSSTTCCGHNLGAACVVVLVFHYLQGKLELEFEIVTEEEALLHPALPGPTACAEEPPSESTLNTEVSSSKIVSVAIIINSPRINTALVFTCSEQSGINGHIRWVKWGYNINGYSCQEFVQTPWKLSPLRCNHPVDAWTLKFDGAFWLSDKIVWWVCRWLPFPIIINYK